MQRLNKKSSSYQRPQLSIFPKAAGSLLNEMEFLTQDFFAEAIWFQLLSPHQLSTTARPFVPFKATIMLLQRIMSNPNTVNLGKSSA